MNPLIVLSGKAGLAGIHWALNGQSSRRLLRSEVQSMLRRGYRPGPFHLTRAKFKPDRNLLAYFNFPAIDKAGHTSHRVRLAVAWRASPDASPHSEGWELLQKEAEQSGLMPVQSRLWKENTDQGLELRVWPFDPDFPNLVRLGNPSYAATLFTSLGIARNLSDVPVISPVRYRPGERHVLRYELDSSQMRDGGGQLLYAKLYANEQDAIRAFGVAGRVVEWLNVNRAGLQGNGPVAMSREESVVFYPHAPGIPLSHQLNRSTRWLAAQLRTIGKALAILHSSSQTLQSGLKQSTFTHEAKVVRRASEHVGVLLPGVYNKILEIVDAAEKHYSSMPQEEPTFTHSDFKSDHLLTTPQGLTLIDFDTCTITDPALDIGKFLADLEWWFTLKGISGVEQAHAELLKGYLGEGEPDDALKERLARAQLFHALILVKIVLRRVPIYRRDWGETTGRMIGQAAQVLHNAITGPFISRRDRDVLTR
ncbi:MAG TPA: phosphotransferase [Anaerolineales bacterium]